MTVATVVVILVLAYLVAAAATYFRARGPRIVQCPVTHETVRIELDATRAAVLLAPRSEMLVRQCSLWPERRACAQWCCDDVAFSSHGCRLEAILADWYQGKQCAFCGRAVPRPAFGALAPALRAPDGRLVEWADIEPMHLYDVLATHQAVCGSCDVAETFRSRYADWVVERPPRGGDQRPPVV